MRNDIHRIMSAFASILTVFTCMGSYSVRASFAGDVRVDDGTWPVQRMLPSIAIDIDGIIYVVWHDDRQGMLNWSLYFAKSVDGGKSFGENIRIGASSFYYGCAPSMAVDEHGTIYVAWYDLGTEGIYYEDADVYVSKSTDGGDSFEPRVRVDHGGRSAAHCPCLALDKSAAVFVAWTDDQGPAGPYHVYLNRSYDGGSTFDAADLQVDKDILSGGSMRPAMKTGENGELYIAYISWIEEVPDGAQISFAMSADHGQTFSRVDTHVTDSAGQYYGPTLAIDDKNDPCVAWFAGDFVDSCNVFFDKSTDGGASFGADLRVNDIDSTAFFPSLDIDRNGIIYVVWESTDGDDDSSCCHIYLSKSLNGGGSFFPNIRIDHQRFSPGHPSVAAGDSGTVYVVWDQQTHYFGPEEGICLAKVNTSAVMDKKGDANCDGYVDVVDVITCVHVILNLVQPTDYCRQCADCNEDSRIDALDVVGIVRRILGAGECRP